MKNHIELIKALRCKRDDCEGCDLAFLDNDEGWMCQYAAKDDDAADAIEALQAYCEQIKTENKMLLNTITADKGVMLERIKCLAQQLPKRGEWKCSYPEIEPNPMFMYGICSICGFEQSISDKLNYCPNCGADMRAKMEGCE